MKSDVILSLERSAIYRGQAFLAKNLTGFKEILRQSFLTILLCKIEKR